MISNNPFPWCSALKTSTGKKKRICTLKFQEGRHIVLKWHFAYKGKPGCLCVLTFHGGIPSVVWREAPLYTLTPDVEKPLIHWGLLTYRNWLAQWSCHACQTQALIRKIQSAVCMLNVNVNCHFKIHPLPFYSFFPFFFFLMFKATEA